MCSLAVHLFKCLGDLDLKCISLNLKVSKPFGHLRCCSSPSPGERKARGGFIHCGFCSASKEASWFNGSVAIFGVFGSNWLVDSFYCSLISRLPMCLQRLRGSLLWVLIWQLREKTDKSVKCIQQLFLNLSSSNPRPFRCYWYCMIQWLVLWRLSMCPGSFFHSYNNHQL